MTDISNQLGRADSIESDVPEVKLDDNSTIETEDTQDLSALDAFNEDTDHEDNAQPDSEPEEILSPPKQSFRELRKQAEEDRRIAQEAQRQRDEAYRLLQMIDNNLRNQQAPQKTVEEDSFDINSLDDEDYANNKVLKKIIKQQYKQYQDLKNEVETSKKSSYSMAVEARIRSEYPDYTSIVSDDNIQRLKEEKPFIFRTIANIKDPYEQAVAAYEATVGINGNTTNQYSREDMQMARNKSKPRPSSAIPPKKKESTLDKIDSYGNMTQKEEYDLYEDTKRKAGWGIYG